MLTRSVDHVPHECQTGRLPPPPTKSQTARVSVRSDISRMTPNSPLESFTLTHTSQPSNSAACVLAQSTTSVTDASDTSYESTRQGCTSVGR